MRLRVLGAGGPAQRRHRLSRHFPPAVLDVLAAHVRNFAGTLAGEEDHLQGGAGDQAGVIERGPEPRHLAVSEDAFAAAYRITIDAPAWIDGDQLLLIAQEKIALAAAKVWLATTGASIPIIIALMSEREIEAAWRAPHLESKCRRTRVSACRQDLLWRLAYSST